MKNLKKKGFTIVELVIVIAVIAVLAAVLIPTFVNLTKKANISADEQAVRQMNIVIAAEIADGTTIDRTDVIEILANAGYNARAVLIPVTSGYQFCWYSAKNSIVLVNAEGKITYPKNLADESPAVGALYNLANGYETQITIDENNSLENVLANLTEESNVQLVIQKDTVVENLVEIPNGAHVTIDLNGKSISSNGSMDTIYNKGDLTIVGGTIENDTEYLVYNEGANLTLENVTVKGEYSAVCNNEGGAVIINSGTYDGSIAVESFLGGSITINGGTFTNSKNNISPISFDESAVLNSEDSNIVINGGTFNGTEGYKLINFESTTSDYKFIINGGTFNGGTEIYSNQKIEINDGIFNCAILSISGLYINGGTFNDVLKISSFSNENDSEDDRDIVITGGNFTYGPGQIFEVSGNSFNGTISGGTFAASKESVFATSKFENNVNIIGGAFTE